MRYSKKEIELLHKLSKDLEFDDLCCLMVEAGYPRSRESFRKKLIELENVKFDSEKQEWLSLVNYRATSLFNNARLRAIEKQLPFDITVAWIKEKLIEGKCEATGLTFVITERDSRNSKRKVNPFAPSLDRIDSSKGYTKDNTQVTIRAFNSFKSDMEQYELIYIAKSIIKFHMNSRQFVVKS